MTINRSNTLELLLFLTDLQKLYGTGGSTPANRQLPGIQCIGLFVPCPNLSRLKRCLTSAIKVVAGNLDPRVDERCAIIYPSLPC